MRNIILLLFMLFSLRTYAGSSVEVSALINGETKNIGMESSVYGDITGVLSTCYRHGKFITDESDLDASNIDYDSEATLAEIEKMKRKDHIRILYKNGPVRLPTRGKSVAVEEIYVRFTELGYPVIYTLGDGVPHSYSQCSGTLLVGHFRCNAVINEIFKIEHKKDSCENH